MTDFDKALAADIRRFAEAARPINAAIARVYVRASYVQAAMFADMLAGRTPGAVEHYLAAGGFETGDPR